MYFCKMKLPSLLSRPKYKRFEYQPRYYDPIKEDIKRRAQSVERIVPGSDISGAFRRRTSPARKAVNLQLLIVVFLICDFLLYFYADNSYLLPGAVLLEVVIIYFYIKRTTRMFFLR